MEFLLQTPRAYDTHASYPLWLVLHGAYAKAEQSITMFGAEAMDQSRWSSRECKDHASLADSRSNGSGWDKYVFR